MPLPLMKKDSGVPLGVYQVGIYTALLIRDAESLGPITYPFMLLITEPGVSDTVMNVTCERTRKEFWAAAAQAAATTGQKLEKEPPWFLCFFDRTGVHYNVEKFDCLPDAETFRTKAFALA